MILRRLTENLKQQHWTAIAIELVIVVLGVFIGTQVSNWNEERETNLKGDLFTERLKTDLRAEDWTYQFMISYRGPAGQCLPRHPIPEPESPRFHLRRTGLDRGHRPDPRPDPARHRDPAL